MPGLAAIACTIVALSGIIVTGTPAVGAAAHTTQPAVARYRFVHAEELSYRTVNTSHFHQGDRASLIEERVDITVWVARPNPDGSYRLFIREHGTTDRTLGGKKHSDKPWTQFHYADYFPDGRALRNRSSQFDYMSVYLFPPLPKDAKSMEAGWQGEAADLRFDCKPATPRKGFTFDATLHTPFEKVLGDSLVSHYTFDPGRGLVARDETSWQRASSIEGEGNGATELVGVKTLSPAALKQFSADADRFFVAIEAYEAQLDEATKSAPAAARGLLDAAAADLRLAAKGIRQPELKAKMEGCIEDHAVRAEGALRQATARSERIGKPAPDFEAPDMEGRDVRLADFRGKIVVLDFWFRGCGPCIRMMPQMNQLAADFAGQPVAVLGMNTDGVSADAQFAVHALGLKYLNLRAANVVERFGVESFPTTIVIDQRGIVRESLTGYSPTLRQDLGRTIRQLLPASRR
jgi:peroxiredoxin